MGVSSKKMKIDLGCGKSKKPGFIGVDIVDYSNLYDKKEFIKCDLNNGMEIFKDNSVDEVYSSHFFEHPLNKEDIINNLVRICKNNAKITIIVPHFSSFMSFQDQHIWHFRADAFSDCDSLIVIRNKICFGKGFNIINYILEPLVNINEFTKKTYEVTGLRNVFPADTIELELIKK